MIVGPILTDKNGNPVFPMFVNNKFIYLDDDERIIEELGKLNYKNWFLWALDQVEHQKFMKRISSCRSFKQINKLKLSKEDHDIFEEIMYLYFESGEWK
jgi:hypothetical protein